MTQKLLSLILLLVISLQVIAQKKEEKTSGYKPGDIAADFSLKNITGEMFSMSQKSDAKGFIVIFTCNHCPYSVAYEDRIIALNEIAEPQGFPVIAINPNDAVAYPADSYENMVERAQEKGFRFPYLHDETQRVAKMYGATRTPHVYLLARNEANQLVVEYIGAIDDNSNEQEEIQHRYVEEAIAELIGGGKPTVNFTKAIGCTIKWKK